MKEYKKRFNAVVEWMDPSLSYTWKGGSGRGGHDAAYLSVTAGDDQISRLLSHMRLYRFKRAVGARSGIKNTLNVFAANYEYQSALRRIPFGLRKYRSKWFDLTLDTI